MIASGATPFIQADKMETHASHSTKCHVDEDPVDPQRDSCSGQTPWSMQFRRVTVRHTPISLDDAIATIHGGDEMHTYELIAPHLALVFRFSRL
jgi:hypothetical protein